MYTTHIAIHIIIQEAIDVKMYCTSIAGSFPVERIYNNYEVVEAIINNAIQLNEVAHGPPDSYSSVISGVSVIESVSVIGSGIIVCMDSCVCVCGGGGGGGGG